MIIERIHPELTIATGNSEGRSQRRNALDHSILIIDDAEFMRVMLRDIVEDMGCTVVGEAGDGGPAVDLYRKTNPDLVLMDITMPSMDGTRALEAIRDVDPEALVVMISALGQKDQVLEAIKLGAQDFIIKPFDQERVRDTLTRLLEPQTIPDQTSPV